MANLQHFLVNSNPTQDIRMLDSFTNCHVFEEQLTKNINILRKNSELVEIDFTYDFRPDKLAYEIYGSMFWYPAILITNKLGSILQFKAEYLNYQCLVPHEDTVNSILDQIQRNKG